MEAESLPAAARYSDHGLLLSCNVRAQRQPFGMPVCMKDEIVDRAAFNETVDVGRRALMKIVDGQVTYEHAVVLALR
jgi:hypothetical protein